LARSVFVLVGLIALVPPTVFSLLEMRVLQRHTALHARHVAHIAQICVADKRVSLDCLRENLEQERSAHGLGWIRVLDSPGALLLAVGDVSPGPLLTGSVLTALPQATGPLARTEVGPDESELRRNVARVFAIHILVGIVVGFGVYQIPVRALQRAILELETTYDSLVHMDKLVGLGEMYAGLTHEVNNPLGIVLARVRMLRAEALERGLDQGLIEDLDVIERHGARIGEIVRGLLTFARKEEMELRPADLKQILREALNLVERPFAKQGVRFRLELDEPLPALAASPSHLQHVFVNLLSNARDAMPAGGTIGVRAYARDGKVLAEIRDSGTGIAPEARERLFEPFFTTKGVGKGTGLGLSVSFGIVRAHGGELVAEDAPGGGALFRVALPALRGPHDKREASHPGRG
jgi:signal transduction histidine kinase